MGCVERQVGLLDLVSVVGKQTKQNTQVEASSCAKETERASLKRESSSVTSESLAPSRAPEVMWPSKRKMVHCSLLG